ncbi:DUF927 domain-containing protein [Planococcus sp. FY231025]|uniref:DUF927 domain-containing protein n=1 Tax=Planococcus sp. FY231025 TaxID=3455699 RepID=UPI003F93D6C7
MTKMLEETRNRTNEIQEILPGAKAILLTGYKGNQDYTRAKAPKSRGWGKKTFSSYEPPSEEKIQTHLGAAGWIGAALSTAHTVVDIDPIKDLDGRILTAGHDLGNRLYELLKDTGHSFHAILTPNGMQFVFHSVEDSGINNETKAVTPLGLSTDYRTAGGQIVFPTEQTADRYFIHKSDRELDEVPFFLLPIARSRINKQTGERNYPVYPLQDGQRNNDINRMLFNTRRMAGEKLSKEQLTLIGVYVNRYFTDPPIEDENELHATIRSVLGASIEKRNPTQLSAAEEFDELPSAPTTQIPKPFKVINGALFRIVVKEKRGEFIQSEEMVCRQAPIITKSFSNVEINQLYYELSWSERGKVFQETVPAGEIATRKELLKLADKGLGVNDLNAKFLIDYFDKYLTVNNIDKHNLVSRLGHIKGAFIHPLDSQGLEILPGDVGEQQTLRAFQAEGTSAEWIENVFDKIKPHSKATLMVIASFASILLKDLKLNPFIIDLSGQTSFGKTSALRVAASVWGTSYLVNEWNLTRIAAERKAAFLGSFPLILDDTRKADERHLRDFIYNFSGGRSKGRGSLEGSQAEATWNNLMLSTGEVPITVYADKAGGAAARVLPITGLPFEGENHSFFTALYQSLDRFYGSIGLEFLRHWQSQKADLIEGYEKFNVFFQKKSSGNEVLARISRHYAALIFTGELLNKFFGMNVDLKELANVLLEISDENKDTDKPMQLLETILSALDADRKSISGRYEPLRDLKAIYKDETIFLLPAYVKEVLQTETLSMRKEWRRRGLTLSSSREGKEVDYKVISHLGKTYKAIPVDPKVVQELGFDFSESDNAEEFSIIPQ